MAEPKLINLAVKIAFTIVKRRRKFDVVAAREGDSIERERGIEKSRNPWKDELFRRRQQAMGLCEGVKASWELNLGRSGDLDRVTSEGLTDKISFSLLAGQNYAMVTRLSILFEATAAAANDLAAAVPCAND